MPYPDSPARRVIYVTHRVPFPPDKGDRIRNYHVLLALGEVAEVHLVALADEPVSDETRKKLGELCARVEIVPVSRRRWLRAGLSALGGGSLSQGLFREPAAAARLKTWAEEMPGAPVVVSASPLADYLTELPGERRKVVDMVDVDSQKWLDFAAAKRGVKSRVYRLEARRLRKLEAALPRQVDAVTLVSVAEAKVYDEFAGQGAATVATNGVDLDYYAAVPPGALVSRAVAFVGAMDYLPNVDAAVWFADEVWPRVRVNYPDAEFRVVGRRPAPAVARLASRDGVVVTGDIADVRPSVATAMGAVVPMRLSRGLQNKVLEAMAMAKPVIASPAAVAALDVTPKEHLLLATTPHEWVAAVGVLFDSADRRRELGASARDYVEKRHDWGRCLQPLVDAVFPPGGAS